MSTLILAIRILLTYRNGFMFFLEKASLLSANDSTTYTTWRGLKYKCRRGTSDFAILNEILIFKEYANPQFHRLTPQSIVVDFGGQAGSFAVSTAFYKDCKVYVFEPDQTNFNLLQENIRLNNLQDQVFAYNYAIARKKDTYTFYLSPHGNKGVHSMFYKGPQPVEVEGISPLDVLETINNQQIDLLKMDIEGGEHEIILPEFALFFDHVNALAMEYHAQEHVSNRQPVEELARKLTALGFKVKQSGTPEIGLIYAEK